MLKEEISKLDKSIEEYKESYNITFPLQPLDDKTTNEILSILIDIEFQNRISKIKLEDLHSFLEFHYQNFNGNKEKFVLHTYQLLDSVVGSHKEIFIKWMNDKLLNYTSSKSSDIKLLWNENSNVLTYLFSQLRILTNKEGKPIIGNTIDDLSIFLKENVSCFENTKLTTIRTMLDHVKGKPQKTSRIIEIVTSKE